MIQVKFKKLSTEAQTPSRAKEGDAGFDLYASSQGIQVYEVDPQTGKAFRWIEYKTDIAVEIPPGHVGLIFPRSSITSQNLMLKNSVGVVDSGYRGEISFRFAIDSEEIYQIYTRAAVASKMTDETINTKPGFYLKGERIGQMIVMPIPAVEFVEVEDLSKSKRGTSGFGSSGK